MTKTKKHLLALAALFVLAGGALVPGSARAQFKSPAAPETPGSACSGTSFIWPDSNGLALQCSGGVWVEVTSGGGGSGSGVTYQGMTSSTYDGAGVGGWTGANAKCVAQFGAGARMMTLYDLQAIGRTTSFAANGWFDCRDGMTYMSTGSVACSYSPATNSGHCINWGTNNSGSNGFYVNTAGSIASATCNNVAPIHCVK